MLVRLLSQGVPPVLESMTRFAGVRASFGIPSI
jgi:hypothetical protein